jgi:soluble lytic murein transglycosylase-like protein
MVVAAWYIFHASNGRSSGPPSGSGGGGDDSGGVSPSNYSIDSIGRAVAWVESRGRQYDANGNVLKSKAGALGIMQLMPSTAAQLGIDPNDEEQNLAGGESYLQQLFAKYGNWEDALAAYNWGPGKVDAALASGSAYPGSVQEYIENVEAQAGVS